MPPTIAEDRLKAVVLKPAIRTICVPSAIIIARAICRAFGFLVPPLKSSRIDR
jgi:hypothetical protein